MTDSTAATVSSMPPHSLPLPIPSERILYSGLKTDHYPWTEVMVDLAARQAQSFSGAFDAVQDERWARFVWVSGSLLGGFTRGGLDVSWTNTMLALPRARVTLTALPPAVASILWVSRAALGRYLPGTWPDMHAQLQRELFYGTLVSGEKCSYWDSGEFMGGQLPDIGGRCLLYTPHTEYDREALIAFWKDLISQVYRYVPQDEVWRQVIVRLSGEFSCLDPFVQDVSLRYGTLHIDPSLSVSEFRPALHAVLRAVLARAGVRINELNLEGVRNRPEWASSGLEGR